MLTCSPFILHLPRDNDWHSRNFYLEEMIKLLWLIHFLKYFHVYHYFKEAEDDKMCKSIEAAIKKEMNFQATSLTLNIYHIILPPLPTSNGKNGICMAVISEIMDFTLFTDTSVVVASQLPGCS